MKINLSFLLLLVLALGACKKDDEPTVVSTDVFLNEWKQAGIALFPYEITVGILGYDNQDRITGLTLGFSVLGTVDSDTSILAYDTQGRIVGMESSDDSLRFQLTYITADSVHWRVEELLPDGSTEVSFSDMKLDGNGMPAYAEQHRQVEPGGNEVFYLSREIETLYENGNLMSYTIREYDLQADTAVARDTLVGEYAYDGNKNPFGRFPQLALLFEPDGFLMITQNTPVSGSQMSMQQDSAATWNATWTWNFGQEHRFPLTGFHERNFLDGSEQSEQIIASYVKR